MVDMTKKWLDPSRPVLKIGEDVEGYMAAPASDPSSTQDCTSAAWEMSTVFLL